MALAWLFSSFSLLGGGAAASLCRVVEARLNSTVKSPALRLGTKRSFFFSNKKGDEKQQKIKKLLFFFSPNRLAGDCWNVRAFRAQTRENVVLLRTLGPRHDASSEDSQTENDAENADHPFQQKRDFLEKEEMSFFKKTKK